MKKEKRILKWIPLFAALVLAVITLIVYSATTEERSVIMYPQIIATAFVPAIFPLIGNITKRDYPIFINVLILIHIVLANDLGSALGLYGRIGCWDLIMHGYFGFVFSVIMYMLLLQWNGDKLNRFGFMTLIFLSTSGAAALWEVWEYLCDVVFGGDAQRVKEALANGVSPVSDTMTDIIIAFAGVLVFYITLYIDGLFDHKFQKVISAKVTGKKTNFQ